MIKKTLFFSALLLFCTTPHLSPCTTAVISAKASSSGRSMIWKLRDTDTFENSMRYFNDGKYSYLGLVNSNDPEGLNVWGGSNSAGFAIMNSASYNVNLNDTTSLSDREGVVMKQALRGCATLAEFEQFLDNLPKPMGLASHFGVIDARGGAAFYEVDNYSWTKFDANEAPEGYVIRTNYSQSGKPDAGYGFIRRETAEKLFTENAPKGNLNSRTILQHFSRCFYHPVFSIDFREKYEKGNYDTDFISTDDFITRHGSASAIVVEGVKENESPDMNTVWVQVGFPETTVSLPLWIRGGENIPELLRYDETLQNCPLNRYALQWKKTAYPFGRADGYHYLKMTELINPRGTGFVQRIERLEKEIFSLTETQTTEWLRQTPQPEQIAAFYELLNKKVSAFYESFQKPEE